MKLYWLPDEQRYVHRQSDIPKGMTSEVRDIPTDLAGLMAHLNELHQQAVVETTPEPAAVEPPPVVPVTPPAPASTVMTDCDIEDHIHNASPVRLAVLAQAVCWRIKELADGHATPSDG